MSRSRRSPPPQPFIDPLSTEEALQANRKQNECRPLDNRLGCMVRMGDLPVSMFDRLVEVEMSPKINVPTFNLTGSRALSLRRCARIRPPDFAFDRVTSGHCRTLTTMSEDYTRYRSKLHFCRIIRVYLNDNDTTERRRSLSSTLECRKKK
ncbi:hypothetical protein BDM02DRAFT_2817387 [Thelephora ganbajun]|uniref:Uncharacterized protein n=1 Tax=Thelephora ganbajun TaxID=370292 RepID=A0ACB6ZBH7_THEGA|nr:hypothetical protein BDM02DRAFT_2817387 [Thelephora ganbajun]